MSKGKSAEGGEKAVGGFSEADRDSFIRHMIGRRCFIADELSFGSMNGAVRKIEWFHEAWKCWMPTVVIDAHTLARILEQWGFQPTRTKTHRALRLPATILGPIAEEVGASATVTRNIDGENLTPAEQRRFRARLQAATDRVNAALREVKAQVYVLHTETLSAAPMSEILALQREVNNLVSAAQHVA